MSIEQTKGRTINYPFVVATKEPIDRRNVIEDVNQLDNLNTVYEGMVSYIKSLDRLFLIDKDGNKIQIINEKDYESTLDTITELTKKINGYICDNIETKNCIVDSLVTKDNINIVTGGFVSGSIFF